MYRLHQWGCIIKLEFLSFYPHRRKFAERRFPKGLPNQDSNPGLPYTAARRNNNWATPHHRNVLSRLLIGHFYAIKSISLTAKYKMNYNFFKSFSAYLNNYCTSSKFLKVFDYFRECTNDLPSTFFNCSCPKLIDCQVICNY